jgi:hypothetical protein
MQGNGKSLLRSSLLRPSVLEDIIRPWNEWLDEKWPFSTHLPAVNVKEAVGADPNAIPVVAVAVPIVGACGTVVAVIEDVAELADVVPFAFVAVTVKV